MQHVLPAFENFHRIPGECLPRFFDKRIVKAGLHRQGAGGNAAAHRQRDGQQRRSRSQKRAFHSHPSNSRILVIAQPLAAFSIHTIPRAACKKVTARLQFCKPACALQLCNPRPAGAGPVPAGQRNSAGRRARRRPFLGDAKSPFEQIFALPQTGPALAIRRCQRRAFFASKPSACGDF